MSTSTPTTDETPAIGKSRTRIFLWRIGRPLLISYLGI